MGTRENRNLYKQEIKMCCWYHVIYSCITDICPFFYVSDTRDIEIVIHLQTNEMGIIPCFYYIIFCTVQIFIFRYSLSLFVMKSKGHKIFLS